MSKHGASFEPLTQRLSRFRPGRRSAIVAAIVAVLAVAFGAFFAGSASAQPPTPTPPPSNSAQPTSPSAPPSSGSSTPSAPSSQAQPPGSPAPGTPVDTTHVSPPLPNNAQILEASQSVVNLVITASVDIDKLPASLEGSGLPPGLIRGAHYHADSWSLCSAFFVGETTGPNNGYLSTNGHCLNPAEYVDMLRYLLLNPQDDSSTGKDDSATPPGDPSDPSMPTDPSASKAKPKLTPIDLVDLESKIKFRVQVVRAYDQPTAQQNGSPALNHVVDAKVIDYTDMGKGDYGLVKVDGLPYSPSIPVVTDEPQPGDNVIAMGYSGNLSISALLPNLSDAEINGKQDPYFARPGKLATDLSNVRIRPTYTNGVLSFTNFPMDNGESAFYGANAAVTPGMSGGLAGMVVNGRIAAYGGISFTTALQPINFSSYGLNGYLSKNGVKLDGASAPGGNARQGNGANNGSGSSDGKEGTPSGATTPPATDKVVPTAQGSDLSSPSPAVTIPLWIIAIAIALATLAWLYRALFGDFRKPRTPVITDPRPEVEDHEPVAVAAHTGDDTTVVHDAQPQAESPAAPDARHQREH